MDELLGCFHNFPNIIRAVVNFLSLGMYAGQTPTIETAKLKKMFIYNFDRYAQTALSGSHQQCKRVTPTLHPHPVQCVMMPFALCQSWR